MLPGDLIFDRTQEDVDNRTEKGFYMSEDLNRVGGFVQDIAEFAGLNIRPKTDWTVSQFRTNKLIRAYLQKLEKLRQQFTVYRDTPPLPTTMVGLGYEGANAIEKMLSDMEEIKRIIPASWLYCGELFCGEVLL